MKRITLRVHQAASLWVSGSEIPEIARRMRIMVGTADNYIRLAERLLGTTGRAGVGNRLAAPRARQFDALSEREAEVARLLADGHTTVSTGATLDISENTVRTYVRRIYGKLGVCNRIDFVGRFRVSTGENARCAFLEAKNAQLETEILRLSAEIHRLRRDGVRVA